MGYFAAYWGQIKGFYKTTWATLFARERSLDGSLSDFVMKRGYFWEFLDLHVWIMKLVWRFFVTAVNILFGYVAMIILVVFLAFSPLLLLLISPVFSYTYRKRVKAQGSAL